MNQFSLEGRSIVIAGASRGLGAATAIACARAGARRLVLAARDQSALEAVACEVDAIGAEAHPIVADLTTHEGVAAIEAAAEGVSGCVVAVGANRPEPVLEVEPETFERLVRTNLWAPFFVAQAVGRHLVAQGDGCIVLLSSQMGHVGAPRRSVYCATKHGLEGLMKAMAVELAPSGVRVLTVAPTFVRTDMTAAQLDDPEISRSFLEQIPLGRFGTVADVASAVVYALSPAAALLTGTSLVIDGGWTAR